MINTYVPLDVNFKEDLFVSDDYNIWRRDIDKNPSNYEGQYRCAGSQLLALFGAVPEIKLSFNYTHNQVFETSYLNTLMKALIKSVQEGKGGVAKMTLPLKENKFWNIIGGYDVEVLFVYNHNCTDFEDRLPEKTQQEIKNPKGVFRNYPFYPTKHLVKDSLCLRNEEVVLLASQAEFIVRRNKELFESIFK